MDEPLSSHADRLLLDAKKAILQEHHQRFQDLRKAGRWEEAGKQLHVTLSCAVNLLHDSAMMLEQMVRHKQIHSADSHKLPPSPPASTTPLK